MGTIFSRKSNHLLKLSVDQEEIEVEEMFTQLSGQKEIENKHQQQWAAAHFPPPNAAQLNPAIASGRSRASKSPAVVGIPLPFAMVASPLAGIIP
ncbi:hypothetical protein L2E82_37953 [Cichorium intybus]|uniref:Uncharacterized protein n=1 Tax=Cichorium intybus TaxID=13427 RepID=A0ACB9AEJ3_CICIN|nr:hypothetical protein L2E82_37953 [Cichorium intybus]